MRSRIGDAVERRLGGRKRARRLRCVWFELPAFDGKIERGHGSHLQCRDVDPAPLLPALETGLGELHALGTFQQRPFERRAFVEMADEHLPLGLEAVVVGGAVRHLAPGLEKVDGLRNVGVPHRPRRVHPRLAPALLQAGDRRPKCTVHMESDEIVASHASAPGAVDVRDRAAVELEGRIGGIVNVGVVGFAVLVPAPRDVRGSQAAHALHLAEQVVEHVAPMAQHIEDDAAAVLLAVVPRRPLRRLPVAFEHPVAELAAHREDAAEEAGIDQHLELEQAGQKQLVLHHAVADARFLRRARDIERVLEVVGGRFLAIDVLAGRDRLAQ